MALLLTSVFGVTGCGSDDDEAPVESRIKNTGEHSGDYSAGDIGGSSRDQLDLYDNYRNFIDGNFTMTEFDDQRRHDLLLEELSRDAKLDRMSDHLLHGRGSSLNHRKIPWEEP